MICQYHQIYDTQFIVVNDKNLFCEMVRPLGINMIFNLNRLTSLEFCAQ